MMPLDKAALLFLHQRWMPKRIAWLQIRPCRIPLQALQAMSLSDKKKFGIPDNHGGQTDHPLVLGDRLVSFHSRNLSQKIPLIEVRARKDAITVSKQQRVTSITRSIRPIFWMACFS